MNPLFRIEERELCGKLLVATQSIAPGAVVLTEAPIVVIPKEYIDRYKGHTQKDTELCVAAFSIFKTYMNADQRARYLGMYGPTTGGFAEKMKALARGSIRLYEQPVDEAEQELFVRVSNIARLNAFETDNGAWVVYETACRMLHSCLPNCEWAIEGVEMVIRAMVLINAGEDLTIAYNPTRSNETTAERRFQYRWFKDFTCHCPRCDALGDDTRQFDCFDPTCAGRHYACQPLSKRRLNFPDAKYTGVEYVKPHLLPCTACARPPPAEYQARMLAEEKRWEAQLTKWEDEVPSVLAGGHDAIRVRLRELEALQLPRWHRRTVHRSNLHRRLSMNMIVESMQANAAIPSEIPFDIHSILHALEVYESIRPNPHAELEGELYAAMTCSLFVKDDALTLSLCLRVIRIHLLRCGRENRRVEEDRRCVQLLQRLAATRAGAEERNGCCAFCEESLERAAFKLSLCGRCRKVSYCSVGCQRAHWPVHKAQCKNV
jgi:hypothetical protein